MKLEGRRQEGSHGLVARGCATWWACPWGEPSKGMEPAGTDTRGSFAPYMVLFGVVFRSTRQTYFDQYVGFTQHKDGCAETQAWAMLSLGGVSINGMAILKSSVTSIPPVLPFPPPQFPPQRFPKSCSSL